MNVEWRKRWIWRPGAWLCLALVGWHAAAPAQWGWLSIGQVWGLLGVMVLFLVQHGGTAEKEDET